MTTIKAPENSDPVREIQTHLSSQFDVLKNKTETKAQNILFQDDLFQASPVKNAKPAFEGDFPISPLSLALAPNARIAKIAFPASPPRSPSKDPYDTCSTPSRSPVSTPPKLKRSLFGHSAAFSEERKLEMPLPNLPLPSFPTEEAQTTKTQTPPPTPSKKQRTGNPVSVFKKQHEALTNNTFKYDVTYLAKGSYSNVYTLETTPVQVIPGVDNSTLVLKAFHGEKSGFGERSLRGYLHNEIENYRAVIAAGLPVAQIYNVDTAKQDGYIIQQKISGKIDLMNGQQMLQVRRFFEISVGQGLIMDLMPQNFALENGQVVLFDFVEDPEDGIDIFNKKAIETWLDYYQKAGGTEAQAAAFLNGLSANHYKGYVQELSPSSPD